MLVLSRRTHEKILIPSINAAIEVVAVKPGVVRLGIEAPPEVRILREEVAASADDRRAIGTPGADRATDPAARQLGGLLQSRLRLAVGGLGLLRRELQTGRPADAEETLGKVEEELRSLLQRAAGAAAPLPGPGKARKALVVEDDHNECELLAGFLRLAGLEVATAGDGTDALDYLRSQGRPDVVLLDMILPRCDGPTTVRAIRRDPALAGLKIYGVTGHSSDEFDLASGPGGIDRWFRKPLNPEALVHDLSQELDSSLCCV